MKYFIVLFLMISLSAFSQENKTSKDNKEVPCDTVTNYRIVFKSGAITELKNVCLLITSPYGKPDVYKFYSKKKNKVISVLFDHKLVDAIFIIQ